MKLSQWHDGSVKPVHIGVYQIKRTDVSTKTMFSFFDGNNWLGWVFPCDFKKREYPDNTCYIIYGQDRQWRGIVKDKK